MITPLAGPVTMQVLHNAQVAQALQDACAQAGVPEPFLFSAPPLVKLEAVAVPLFLLASRRFASTAQEVWRGISAGDRPSSAPPAKEGDDGANAVKKRAESLIRHFSDCLTQAKTEGLTLPQLRQRLFGTFSGNALVIIFDRVGSAGSWTPMLKERFRMELQITEAETEVLIRLWNAFLREEAGPTLFDDVDWKKPDREVRMDLAKRMAAALERGENPEQGKVARALAQAPRVAAATLENVVLGLKDFPRETRKSVEKSLGLSAPLPPHAVENWEEFWRRQALLYGWTIKPAPEGHDQEVRAAILYAELVNWSVLRFEEWLKDHTRKHPDKKFIEVLLYATLDWDVVRGKRKRPRERPTYTQLGKNSSHSRLTSTAIFDWCSHWEDFARRLKIEPAIRPFQEHAERLRQRWIRSGALPGIFARAAKAKKNRARKLYQLLQEEGSAAHAAVAANVLKGINHKPRLPAKRLQLRGYGLRSRNNLEEKILELAGQNGFAAKKEHKGSVVRRDTQLVLSRLGEIRAEAAEKHLPLNDLAGKIKGDNALQEIYGDRFPIFLGVLDAFLEGQSLEEGAEEIFKRERRRRLVALGMRKNSFNAWWGYFERWVLGVEES